MAGLAGAGPSSLVLGIDEAGRGSLVGPLVVGGFASPRERVCQLTGLGVRDSKLLSHEQREAVYRKLGSLGSRLSLPLPPAEVDRWVTRGKLNLLEARAFAELVRRSGAGEVYVDACDPIAERFGRTVAGIAATGARVRAFHRADRDIPVVSAGSIVAKVCRDRAVARLRRQLGADLGSGYPSDPKTVAFVEARLRERHPHPSWLRWSWESVERLKPPEPLRALDAGWG